MISPDRIEAAARVLRSDLDEVDGPLVRQMALQVLEAAYPELANGTAWLAPMGATPDMIDAGRDVGPDAPYGLGETRQRWAAFRDAFLQEPKEP